MEEERRSRANGCFSPTNGQMQEEAMDQTLYGSLHRLFVSIFFPGPDTSPHQSLFQRLRISFTQNWPSLKEASTQSARKLLRWTRSGSPFRALSVISVGTIISLALTGLLVFMLFFVAAITNAIIISLLMSLAAAGSFLAFFIAGVTGTYIAALSVAVFAISTATISTIIAVMVATGWIVFFWTVWLASKKSVDFIKQSLSMTVQTLSAYSATRHSRHRAPDKVVD